MSRTVPYSGRDQCELVVGVITKLLPRPELTADQAAPWPPRLPELMLRCYAEEPADRPDFAGVLEFVYPQEPSPEALWRSVVPRIRQRRRLGLAPPSSHAPAGDLVVGY